VSIDFGDLGFVFGAVGIGFIADLSGIGIAIQFVAWIALASGIFVLIVILTYVCARSNTVLSFLDKYIPIISLNCIALTTAFPP
jgi:hypothetical protein